MLASTSILTFIVTLMALGKESHQQASGISSRIMFGTATQRNDFKFAVRILLHLPGGIQEFCGGTLIEDNWVLTAAHCLKIAGPRQTFAYPESIIIQVGAHNLSDTNSTIRQNIPAAMPAFVHPGYNGNDSSLDDIGLIRLVRPVELSNLVDVAKLPVEDSCIPIGSSTVKPAVEPGCSSATAIGWGKTERLDARGNQLASENLLQATLDIRPFQVCLDTFTGAAAFTQNVLCAGGNSEQDTCNGDSGGPLLCKNDNNAWVQIALTSWGSSACGSHRPGIYTRICPYMPWIRETIESNRQKVTGQPTTAEFTTEEITTRPRLTTTRTAIPTTTRTALLTTTRTAILTTRRAAITTTTSRRTSRFALTTTSVTSTTTTTQSRRGFFFEPSDGTLRLFGGTANAGYVEVYYNGAWGAVCDDRFDDDAAQVVCRQLGLNPVRAQYLETIPYDWRLSGTSLVWLDDVMCFGHEKTLIDCNHQPWGLHDCTTAETAAVRCGASSQPDTTFFPWPVQYETTAPSSTRRQSTWWPGADLQFGWNALHQAAYYGDLEKVRQIVENQPIGRILLNQRATPDNNALPIHLAAYRGHISVVRYMVSLQDSLKFVRDGTSNSVAAKAYFGNSTVVLEYILDLPGIDIDQREGPGGRTLLHMAAADNNIEVMKLLLDREANAYERDTEAGNLAVHLAAFFGRAEAVRLLIARFPDQILMVNREGSTPRAMAMDSRLNQEGGSDGARRIKDVKDWLWARMHLPSSWGVRCDCSVGETIRSQCARRNQFVCPAEQGLCDCNMAPLNYQLNCERNRRSYFQCSAAPALKMEEVGLTGGLNNSYGAVNIRHNETFGAACQLNDVAAKVLCNILGLPSTNAYSTTVGNAAQSGLNVQAPVLRRTWLSEMTCGDWPGSNIQSVWCQVKPWGVGSCSADEISVVVCR